MSARAAWRLETLGFTQVYRYTAGKSDWAANGLPMEGEQASTTTVADVARRGVPTCRLEERVGDVRDRVRAAGWEMCVVVNEQRVVLGRVRAEGLEADPGASMESVMLAGPTTYRLDQTAAESARHLAERKVESVLVTTSDGVLVGVFYRDYLDNPAHRGETASSSSEAAR
jgi:predicted transcriptional regulator